MTSLQGLHYDLPAEVYYPYPALAQTRLKAMRGVSRGDVTYTPANLKYVLDNPPDETLAMMLGRAFHHMLFTPAESIWWAVRPADMDGRTKEGRAFKEDAESRGLTVFNAKEFGRRDGMCQSCWQHEDTRMILERGRYEVSLFGHEPVMEGPIKARLDIEGVGSNNTWLADFKSTRDAKPGAFRAEVFDRGYHIQAAWYLDLYEFATGQKKDAFLFAAVESEPPHNIKVYELDNNLIEVGRNEYRRMLDLYAECRRSGVWPGYVPGIETIGLPEWIVRKQLSA